MQYASMAWPYSCAMKALGAQYRTVSLEESCGSGYKIAACEKEHWGFEQFPSTITRNPMTVALMPMTFRIADR